MSDERLIAVTLEVTESYRKSFDRQTLAAEILDVDPALADELASFDDAGFAAFLHRLRLDDPDHPVIQYVWGTMESDGEVVSESWSFAPAEKN